MKIFRKMHHFNPNLSFSFRLSKMHPLKMPASIIDTKLRFLFSEVISCILYSVSEPICTRPRRPLQALLCAKVILVSIYWWFGGNWHTFSAAKQFNFREGSLILFSLGLRDSVALTIFSNKCQQVDKIVEQFQRREC